MSATINCLTICQPWAWAILHAGKNIENRKWYSNYRGPLLIHAGKSKKWLDGGFETFDALGIQRPLSHELGYGEILGIVEMVDCKTLLKLYDTDVDTTWAEGPYCHVYANPRAFEQPVPYLGALGFFQVPRELVPEAVAAHS